MSNTCTACPPLRAENAQLRQRLHQLRGEVDATVRFIDQEQVEPTLPRRRFIPTIRGRLDAAAANVDER